MENHLKLGLPISWQDLFLPNGAKKCLGIMKHINSGNLMNLTGAISTLKMVFKA